MDEICKFCLIKHKTTKLFAFKSINSVLCDLNEITIKHIIEYSTAIKISNDPSRNKICDQCFSESLVAFAFKIKVEMAEKWLKSSFKKETEKLISKEFCRIEEIFQNSRCLKLVEVNVAETIKFIRSLLSIADKNKINEKFKDDENVAEGLKENVNRCIEENVNRSIEKNVNCIEENVNRSLQEDENQSFHEDENQSIKEGVNWSFHGDEIYVSKEGENQNCMKGESLSFKKDEKQSFMEDGSQSFKKNEKQSPVEDGSRSSKEDKNISSKEDENESSKEDENESSKEDENKSSKEDENHRFLEDVNQSSKKDENRSSKKYRNQHFLEDVNRSLEKDTNLNSEEDCIQDCTKNTIKPLKINEEYVKKSTKQMTETGTKNQLAKNNCSNLIRVRKNKITMLSNFDKCQKNTEEESTSNIPCQVRKSARRKKLCNQTCSSEKTFTGNEEKDEENVKNCIRKEFNARTLETPKELLVDEHCCSICDKNFKSARNLRDHMSTHSGKRDFLCNTCGKLFARLITLKSHIRIHTNERPYTCLKCNKSFKQKFPLVEHLKSHTDTRDLICELCGKGFIRYGTWKVHMKTHSADKRHECEICGIKYCRSDVLKKHVMKIHGKDKRVYKCYSCSKEYGKLKWIKAHIKKYGH